MKDDIPSFANKMKKYDLTDIPSRETVERMFNELFGGKQAQKMRQRQARIIREIEKNEKEEGHDEIGEHR